MSITFIINIYILIYIIGSVRNFPNMDIDDNKSDTLLKKYFENNNNNNNSKYI